MRLRKLMVLGDYPTQKPISTNGVSIKTNGLPDFPKILISTNPNLARVRSLIDGGRFEQAISTTQNLILSLHTPRLDQTLAAHFDIQADVFQSLDLSEKNNHAVVAELLVLQAQAIVAKAKSEHLTPDANLVGHLYADAVALCPHHTRAQVWASEGVEWLMKKASYHEKNAKDHLKDFRPTATSWKSAYLAYRDASKCAYKAIHVLLRSGCEHERTEKLFQRADEWVAQEKRAAVHLNASHAFIGDLNHRRAKNEELRATVYGLMISGQPDSSQASTWRQAQAAALLKSVGYYLTTNKWESAFALLHPLSKFYPTEPSQMPNSAFFKILTAELMERVFESTDSNLRAEFGQKAIIHLASLYAQAGHREEAKDLVRAGLAYTRPGRVKQQQPYKSIFNNLTTQIQVLDNPDFGLPTRPSLDDLHASSPYNEYIAELKAHHSRRRHSHTHRA